MARYDDLGKKALAEANIKEAFGIFSREKNLLYCGYCSFLSGEIGEAERYLKPVAEESSFALWLLFLINLCNGKHENTTYLRVRAFYEQDTEMLIRCSQREIAGKIFDESAYIARFNGEVYKYAGRVLLNNGYVSSAEKMFKKSLEVCYRDPETHFLLSEVYEIRNYRQIAVEELNKTLEVYPGYKPAENKLKEIIKRL